MKKNLLVFLSGLSLASFAQTYDFTNATATGRYGPTQAQVTTEYTGTSLDGAVTVTTQGIQEWTVPTSGSYHIVAVGACGGEGQGTYYPGLPGTGATIEGDFNLTAGTVLKIVVGQKGIYGDNGSGGGGGSFVFTGSPGGAGLMIAAGGGGGHGHGSGSVTTGAHGGGGSATTSQVDGAYGTGNGGPAAAGQGGNAGTGPCSYSGLGAGGTGWYSSGLAPAACGTATGGNYLTYVGGDGGSDGLVGGFGGGGGSDGNGSPGGGGGGYTGGSGGNDFSGSAWGAGAGAGSYNSGSNQVNTAGVTGAASGYTHGTVTITFNCSPTASLTLDNATLPDLSDACYVDPTPPTATNNCGTINGVPDVSFPMSTTGTITWTFDDGVTTLTQTQNVTINDTNPPVPNAGSLPGASGQCEVLALPAPTATDCGLTITGVPDVSFPITTSGLTVITWTFTDGSGNSSTQTQNVTINDVAGPTPDAANLPDVDECLSATPTAPTATDNCDGPVTGTPDVSFPITTPGQTVVTWTYQDGNGNTTTQTQNVNISSVDVGVTQAGTMLTADNSAAGLQWLDCDNNYAVIAGETNASYTPSVTGNYAVQVTDNGCIDTSACYLVDYTGIGELNADAFIVSPNPAKENLMISFPTSELYTIEIIDQSGKVVIREVDLNNIENTIHISNLEPGTYHVNIINNDRRVQKKFVKL